MEPILFIIVWVISYVILYCVIKYAVKSAILEANWEINKAGGSNEDIDAGGDEYIINNDSDNNEIAKIICPKCGRKHDMDYPKCPYCGFGY